MNKILRRPNWQVFLYMVVGHAVIPNTEVGNYIRVVYGLTFLIWVLKINEELYFRLKGRTDLNLTLFQIGLTITFCYLSVIFLFTDGYQISSEKDNFAEYGWKVWVYVPFTIFVFLSYFYALYFTSSAVNQLERELFDDKGDDSLLLFAALFFFPIGIWWIQPRIN